MKVCHPEYSQDSLIKTWLASGNVTSHSSQLTNLLITQHLHSLDILLHLVGTIVTRTNQ